MKLTNSHHGSSTVNFITGNDVISYFQSATNRFCRLMERTTVGLKHCVGLHQILGEETAFCQFMDKKTHKILVFVETLRCFKSQTLKFLMAPTADRSENLNMPHCIHCGCKVWPTHGFMSLLVLLSLLSAYKLAVGVSQSN